MSQLRRHARWYLLGALGLAAVLVWGAVFRIEAHRGTLFVHVLDVGQGDAILVDAPGGVQILVDGGPDRSVLAGLGEVMPAWDRSIELVVLTHPHADHLDGLLAVLERYDVGMVLESGVNHSIAEYDAWRAAVTERAAARVAAVRGQRIALGGAVLDVLSPFRSFDGVSARNIHEATVVLLLSFGGGRVLLTGDAEAPVERAILAAAGAEDTLRVDVLKVGHHGSKTSTLPAFLAAARPRFATISVGRKNRYGHPTGEILERLAAAGVRVLRTDRDGTISFSSAGGSFSLAAP